MEQGTLGNQDTENRGWERESGNTMVCQGVRARGGQLSQRWPEVWAVGDFLFGDSQDPHPRKEDFMLLIWILFAF